MAGKARPCLRKKVLFNVDRSTLSITDKVYIHSVFEKLEQMELEEVKKKAEMKKEKNTKIFFLCDRGKCEECTNTYCGYTTDIMHAKNFEPQGNDLYIENDNGAEEIRTEVIKEFVKMFEANADMTVYQSPTEQIAEYRISKRTFYEIVEMLAG